MKKYRYTCFILALMLLFAAFCGCSQKPSEGGSKEIGKEVGKWHAEIKLNDISASMSDEDKAIMSMLAGNIMFEIDAEFCEDGTFTYFIDTDKLQEAISGSVSTFLGFFMEIDVSLFTDRIVEAALQDALNQAKSEYYGKYTKSDELITARQGDECIYFKQIGNILIQLDDDGNDFLRFERVS